MSIYKSIEGIINYSLTNNLITNKDKTYVRNQLMALLNLDYYLENEALDENIYTLLKNITEYACEIKLIENNLDEKEILESKIMNIFLSKPSEIENIFYEKYKVSPKDATDYFYSLSKATNYIKTSSISKNINLKVDTLYGEIDITINLSKPEKDPKTIAKQKNSVSNSYPKCLLCFENEGYVGRLGYPARSNHRVINIDIHNKLWAFQYSPYLYYNEHCILICEEHRDMRIDKHTFLNILLFVEKFPHYFLGSNADLPIVGGSILSHDHYQGGCYQFAMEKASEDFKFLIPTFKTVNASILKWPMSVIRLKSKSINELVLCATHILDKWREYSDDYVNIIPYTNETPHNTITPIARYRNNLYQLDLVLRNNLTTEEFPMGLFHPHEDVHHIKKENIGLIEVMGLAVLPPRLEEELEEVKKYILDLPNQIKAYHVDWANTIKASCRSGVNETSIEDIIKIELGKKFIQVLEYSGVFKRTATGLEGFKRFINTL